MTLNEPMPRTYKPRNACITRSRLSEEEGLGVIYNYLCQVDLKEIAEGLKTTEPTVHRLVTRLQDRLACDSYLLHVLCGLEVEGEDFLKPHRPMLEWLANADEDAKCHLKACIYDCPGSVDMTLTAFRAYAFRGDFEFDTRFEDMAIDNDTTFLFRKDFCPDCPNPIRHTGDLSILSAMSFSEILRPCYRKHFVRHLPAMLVRSSARWRMHQATAEQRLYGFATLDDFPHHLAIRDEIIRKWLSSAVPYLRAKPL